MTSATSAVHALFPAARGLREFLDSEVDALGDKGFHPGEALAVTAGCRDEIASGYRTEIGRRWDQSFDFSSLSGLPFAGVTGMKSVIDHVPHTAGHPEIVIFAMPHIGVLEDGTMGQVMRHGRSRPTTACGSLMAAAAAARGTSGRGHPDQSQGWAIDPLDPEQSLVQSRLAAELGDVSKLNPAEVVIGVAAMMVEDLWALVTSLTVPTEDDVALIAGVLIHGPDGDFIAPHTTLIRTDGILNEQRFLES